MHIDEISTYSLSLAKLILQNAINNFDPHAHVNLKGNGHNRRSILRISRLPSNVEQHDTLAYNQESHDAYSDEVFNPDTILEEEGSDEGSQTDEKHHPEPARMNEPEVEHHLSRRERCNARRTFDLTDLRASTQLFPSQEKVPVYTRAFSSVGTSEHVSLNFLEEFNAIFQDIFLKS